MMSKLNKQLPFIPQGEVHHLAHGVSYFTKAHKHLIKYYGKQHKACVLKAKRAAAPLLQYV